MADDQAKRTIVEQLKEVEAHARKLVQAGERNDWAEAEAELRKIQSSVLAATALVEMANDIQRGQIR
jgi:hypothetical protein